VYLLALLNSFELPATQSLPFPNTHARTHAHAHAHTHTHTHTHKEKLLSRDMYQAKYVVILCCSVVGSLMLRKKEVKREREKERETQVLSA